MTWTTDGPWIVLYSILVTLLLVSWASALRETQLTIQ
jgi:hypothetical protein